jgi:osmotically-inducible protein OsmY
MKDILDPIYWDSRVDASDIFVEVRDGHVTLLGTVPSYTARLAVESEALIVSGVAHVDNRLTVVAESVPVDV